MTTGLRRSLAGLFVMFAVLAPAAAAAPRAFARLVPPASPRATAPRQPGLPRLEPAACPFGEALIPAGERVECGYLVVLEDRSQPTGRTLRLAVAVLKAWGESPAPDPVIFLSGGPGLPALEGASFWLSYDRSLRARRDLILFDQRGTGHSEPDMRCPELDRPEVADAQAALPPGEAARLYVAAALECRDRLRAEGVNLAAYNCTASAADLADLRQVLGYEQWNLYGYSYGGRLALTTLREQAQGIRSLVLDSPRTLGVASYESFPADVDRAFKTLFGGCTAEPACRAAFPEVEASFRGLVEQFNGSPIVLAIDGSAQGSLTINGDQVVGGGFNALYDRGLIPYLPLAIDQISAGNMDVLAGFASALSGSSGESAGMTFSVLCHEEAPFNDPARTRAEVERFPHLRSYFERFLLPDLAVCAEWGAGKSRADEAAPVRSDVPALIMTGEYDPIHPPWWGQTAADHLSRSYHYTLPAFSHGNTFGRGCQAVIRDAFLENPLQAPDASCIGQMPPMTFVTEVYVHGGVLRFARSLQNPPPALLAVLGLVLAVFLSALAVWPVAHLAGRRRPTAARARFAAARWLAGLVIVLNLVFLAGLAAFVAQTAAAQEPLLLFGLPPVAAPLFALPLLSAGLTLAVAVLAAWAWARRQWSTAARLHYGLVALAAVAFLGLLAWWGLLRL
jgi:pimeloyl-ACP methyl ester carboxylesterase